MKTKPAKTDRERLTADPSPKSTNIREESAVPEELLEQCAEIRARRPAADLGPWPDFERRDHRRPAAS